MTIHTSHHRPGQQRATTAPPLLLIVCIAAVMLQQTACSTAGGRSGTSLSIQYATAAAPYMTTLTHSGAPVSDVIRDLGGNPTDDGLRSLLQPYLAPMSRLLVTCPISPDSNRIWRDLATELVARERGVPRARPAWRDLLDEGRYRVCYDADGVRLFAPGADADAAFREAWPLLRHPVRFLKSTGLSSCATVELFAYSNEYESLTLTVHRSPHVIDPAVVSTDSGLALLNLEALDDFLRTGTAPQAIEIAEDDRLYLCGRAESRASLVGQPLTVADLAVAYRAVFWPGLNEAYISLDKNEDNRFAKVNFGGLLADTRIGQVVLDADRYFKTISTGLDPFERKDIAARISAAVPGFMPGDVIELLGRTEGSSEYRYWFYPDSLRVVTDGNIGVVISPRFLADVERQDGPRHISLGQRQSIDDLNLRYDSYSRAISTYAELDNVGQLLGLMFWLRETKADQRLDLAALLSVELPAWQTERATGKMMAVNSYHGPESRLRAEDPGFLTRTRVFDFSARLAACSPQATDDELIKFGHQCFDGLPRTSYVEAADLSMDQRVDGLKAELDREQAALDRLEREIAAAERTIDQYSQASVDAYNDKVGRYNHARDLFNAKVEQHNRLADASNAAGITSQMNISVGGGIDLTLKDARIVRKAPEARELRMLVEARPHFATSGKVQVGGGWVRSRP